MWHLTLTSALKIMKRRQWTAVDCFNGWNYNRHCLYGWGEGDHQHPAHTHNTGLSTRSQQSPVLGLRPGAAAAGTDTLVTRVLGPDISQCLRVFRRGKLEALNTEKSRRLWLRLASSSCDMATNKHQKEGGWYQDADDVSRHQDGPRVSAVCINLWWGKDLVTSEGDHQAIRHQELAQCGQYGPGQRGRRGLLRR